MPEVGVPVVASAVLGGLMMVGLIVGGDLLGSRIRDFKRTDRYVEVKGLVERQVKADLATWPIPFSLSGDTLPEVFDASEKNKMAVLQFLHANGFADADITVGTISVRDRTTSQYDGSNKGPRFVVEQTVTLQSGDVDKVAAANAKTADLIRAGVVVQSAPGQGGGLVYKFNGLNALKPDMITEATRNARASADRFARDSGSRLGAIRSANQGTFSISAANAGSATGEEMGGMDGSDASINKKVRVVATIDYYLED